jgi:hypothetical protein
MLNWTGGLAVAAQAGIGNVAVGSLFAGAQAVVVASDWVWNCRSSMGVNAFL